jgi:hypothetical protein
MLQAPARSQVSRASASGSAFSIFQEPWLLDIVTDGDWAEAVVRHEGAEVGRLPYACSDFYGQRIAMMPHLVPTLGPAIVTLPGKTATTLRRRLEITNGLIDQLPELACFEQVFDPRVSDAAGFVYRGFVVGTSYGFRIPQARAAETIWCGMQAARREQILGAAAAFRIQPVDDIEEVLRLDRAVARGKGVAERLRKLVQAVGERGVGMILGARDECGVLGAAVVLVWDKVATYRLVGARGAGVPEAAESLLLWEAMQLMLPQQRAFDLGAVGSAGSLRFLAGFGDYLVQRVQVRRATPGYRWRKAVAAMVGVAAV